MELAIAGNTSLAYYCLEKLCRDGYDVSKVIIPEPGTPKLLDSADFVNLVGEFDIDLIHISAADNYNDKIRTDLLISLEWPKTMPLPVEVKIARVSSNLAGQFDNGYLLDVAADIYNSSKTVNVQLLLEETGSGIGQNDMIIYEPPFFSVLGGTEFEINQLDDLRSVKTKAAASLYRLLVRLIAKIKKDGKIPHQTQNEIVFKRVKTDRIIDWNKGALYIHNLVRSCTHPGPGVYAWHDDNKLIIWRGHFYDLSDRGYEDFAPGIIVDIVEELGVVVKTGHGLFLVSRIRPMGSPELPAWVWAAQQHIFPGDGFHIYSGSKTEVDVG